jgi:hypothetical protein
MQCLLIVNKRLIAGLRNLLPFTRLYSIMPFSTVSILTKDCVPGAYLHQRTWSTEALYQWDPASDEVEQPRVQSRSSPTLFHRPTPAPISSSKQGRKKNSSRVQRMIQWFQKRGGSGKTAENKEEPYRASSSLESAMSIQHEQGPGEPVY